MSVPVGLAELGQAIARHDYCFVITVSPTHDAHGPRPRVVATRVAVEGDELVVEAGRSTVANVGVHPDLTLCFPPRSADEMSLLVDGRAVAVGDTTVRIAPVSAVRHRAAPGVDAARGGA
jgi:hypothetical protein